MPTLTRAALLKAGERGIPIERQYRVFLRHERLYGRKSTISTAKLTAAAQLLPNVVGFGPGRCDRGIVLDPGRDREPVGLSPVIVPELVDFVPRRGPRSETFQA